MFKIFIFFNPLTIGRMVCTVHFFLLTGAVLCEEKNLAHIQANLLKVLSSVEIRLIR
jgi:hypothetical protein